MTVEHAWAAGFFEGEGTVRISRPARRNWGTVVVSVVNTDQTPLRWFNDRWPGYFKRATGLRANQRPAWVWVVAARRACVFLSAIRPHVVRPRVRLRIDHALQFQAGKRNDVQWLSDEERLRYAEDQWNAHWFMGALNKRGTEPSGAEALIARLEKDR